MPGYRRHALGPTRSPRRGRSRGRCGGVSIFGFPTAKKAGAIKECDAPSIYKIVQGKSGVLSVYFTPFYRQVVNYEFRWGPQGRDRFSPDAWAETRQLRQGRRPVVVENLTPGTIYCFQVRAYCTNETIPNGAASAARMGI
jgi:hypothetical protein